MREFMTAEEVNINHIYFVSSVVDLLMALVILLRAIMIRVVIGDVMLIVHYLQVLCIMRSVLVVDQRGPIRSGSRIILYVALTYFCTTVVYGSPE